MITIERAYELRAIIERASALLPDADALDAPELFPAWEVGKAVTVDERLRYGDKLYKVVQAHTTQADWTPDATPALFVEVAAPGEIPVWVQPTGAHDAYRLDAKVHFPTMTDPIYINRYDHNAYPPDVYGWELWTGGA